MNQLNITNPAINSENVPEAGVCEPGRDVEGVYMQLLLRGGD